MLLNEALHILTLCESTEDAGLKGNKKKDDPSDEQMMQAVAVVVNNEIEKWPITLLGLIGRSHPPREYFLNGVYSVIEAYMKIAREKLTLYAQKQIRSMEVSTARDMGPFRAQLSVQEEIFRKELETAEKELIKERDLLLRESRSRIYKEYEHKIENLKIHASYPSADALILKDKIRLADEDFETRKEEALRDFRDLEDCINKIYEDRKNVLGRCLMDSVMSDPERSELEKSESASL